MTFRMIVQLWNTNTSAFVSCDADLTENYMYISMKFGTGVHVFCREVGVFNRSSFQSVSYKIFRVFLAVFMKKFQKNLLSELCEKENSTYISCDLIFASYQLWTYSRDFIITIINLLCVSSTTRNVSEDFILASL